jgi:hypothetical protein
MNGVLDDVLDADQRCNVYRRTSGRHPSVKVCAGRRDEQSVLGPIGDGNRREIRCVRPSAAIEGVEPAGKGDADRVA